MPAKIHSLSFVLCFAAAIVHAQTTSSRTTTHAPSYAERLENMTSQHWEQNPAQVHRWYRSFLSYVCQEDIHVKRMHTPEGEERARKIEASGRIPWTDRLPYESLMDLQPSEVQTILTISLEGCHEMYTVAGEQARMVAKPAQQTPQQNWNAQTPEMKALWDQQLAIIDQTRANLREGLTPESFQKLETYVFIGAPEDLEAKVPPSAHNQMVVLPSQPVPLRIQ
jgi:hypothetical protein